MPDASRPDDDQLAALVALAGLAGMSPRRFHSLIELGRPADVWERVLAGAVPPSGRADDPAARWPEQAACVDPGERLEAHRSAGVDVVPLGADDYPVRLAADDEPPPVVFRRGDQGALDRVAVAVVGTRRASRYGRAIAHELGAALAARGVDVVSGLAHGIDAAAHAGVDRSDRGRAVAVVASGLDVVYPRGNRELWDRVAAEGVLMSEWPLGSPPLPWRFPARNRIIAALSVAVVVVESAERGGSMHTVDQAVLRDRPVFAVPGSIRSPLSAGPHRLIADGAHVLGSIEGFVEALGVADDPPGVRDRCNGGATDGATDSWLLDWLGWEPASVEDLVNASERPTGQVLLDIEHELARGTIRRHGARIERVR